MFLIFLLAVRMPRASPTKNAESRKKIYVHARKKEIQILEDYLNTICAAGKHLNVMDCLEFQLCTLCPSGIEKVLIL